MRRQIASSQEEWQIYGMDGELLAEYKASSPASAPEKEYGYRNGQLLVTATGRFNVALAANGAVAAASSAHTCCGFSTTGAINGNNRGPWSNGEGWNDATPDSVPDWIQIEFAGDKSIDEINVFSLHDNYTVENTPTETQTFTLYGLKSFVVQYWNGSTWVTVPGGSVSGNNKVWRKFTFTPITTRKIRVWINQVPDSWSRVVEIQAFGTSAGGEKIQWLVSDHLGTPRMVIDQTGSLANIKRHDYLPFGEELFAPTGGRTTAQGYASGDGIRQQFTSYERDSETGLDYAHARYYNSIEGRFATVDPLIASALSTAPQTWNRYSYGLNNPLRYIDPSGLTVEDVGTAEDQSRQQEGQRRRQQVKVPIEELGEPPPPLVSTITINVPQPREYINERQSDGTFFTGVGSMLEITVRDAAGNPITGISVTESVVATDGRAVTQRTDPAPVRPDGSFTDLVGVGLKPSPTTPITQAEAANVLNRIAQRPTQQNTIQTLRFYAPEGYMLGMAVVHRHLTNLDADGKVKPPTHQSGRPVDNYSIRVRLLTMLPPEK